MNMFMSKNHIFHLKLQNNNNYVFWKWLYYIIVQDFIKLLANFKSYNFFLDVP